MAAPVLPEGYFGRDELTAMILKKARLDTEANDPSDRQRADARAAINPGLAELAQRRIVTFNADAGIPEAFIHHLARYCLFFCAEELGIQPDAAMKDYAEASIKAINSKGPTFEAMEVDPMMQGGVYAGDTEIGRYSPVDYD